LTSIPYLNQLPQTKGVNWKAVLFWGVILGLIFTVVWWFGKDTILTWLAKPTMPDVTGVFQNFTLEKVITFFKNYGFLITGVATACTFIYGLYERHKASQAQTLKLEAEAYANSQVNQYADMANKYKSEAKTYKAQVEELQSHDLAVQYNALKIEKDQLERDVVAFKRQNQDLMDKLANTPVKVVKVRD
jgi:hypothetical protein